MGSGKFYLTRIISIKEEKIISTGFRKILFIQIAILILVFTTSCDQSKTGNAIYTAYSTTPNKENITPASNVEKLLRVDEERINDTIAKLCTENRSVGSDGERKAADFIKSQLDKYGYETEMETFPYSNQKNVLSRETFWDVFPSEDKVLGYSRNLIAYSRQNKIEETNIIVISAHYDCAKSSPGANDNAAGVAALLEVARRFKSVSKDFQVEFIFFGGEEMSLSGSRNYICRLNKSEKKSIIANINIDTIANKDDDYPIFFTVNGKENLATKILTSYKGNKKIQLEMACGISDHFTFEQAGIPSLTIGQKPIHQKIHSPKDSIDTIDMEKVKFTILALTQALKQNFSDIILLNTKEPGTMVQ
ncbi:MAG: M20/M25/M40 family metallo-hydrolase [Bacteroidota bacterium]|nr:M20/M25/M40 family metallo-hydrolase [Bacteroidota bacterium]